jgi:mono/diheme cytochrome c family protein
LILAPNARLLENPAVQRGRELVSRNCAGCHNVALKGPSLNRAAPPFRELGDRHTPETLRQSVGQAVASDHYGMPAIYLSGEDARAIEVFLTAFAHADKKTRRRLAVPSCFARSC